MTEVTLDAAAPAESAAGVFGEAFTAFARVAAQLEDSADLDGLLRVVARQVGDLVGVERCSIHLRDEKAGLFRGCVGHAGDQDIDTYVKRSLAGMPADGMTLELLRTKRPVIIANAHDDARIIKSTARFWSIHSMMAVPMIFKDEVIGVIYLDDVDRPHAFSAADAEVASLFSQFAAVAVTHVQCKVELRSKLAASQRQIKALRRAGAVDERLSDLVLEGRTLQELVETLAEVLGKPCAVYDRDDKRLAMACPLGAEDGIRPRLLESPSIDTREVREALEANRENRAFVVGPLPSAGVMHRYLVAPIGVDKELWGRLVIMEHKGRFTGGDMLTLRRAATLVALQMSTERRAIEADWNGGASLTAELLGGSSEPAVVRRRAERLGVSLDTPRVVMLIAPRTRGSAVSDFRAVVAAFREVAPQITVLATTVGDAVAALVDVPRDADDETFLESAEDLLAGVCARLPGVEHVAAAISTVRSDPEGYAEAYTEAQQVVDCISRFSRGGSAIFSAADLGAGRVFLSTSDPDVVRRFADSTFGSLVRDASKADLLATLCSFFDNMASIRRCATRLGVHENTIRYRLARIEELTGLPVTHDPDAQLRARLSLLVLMLEGRLPTGVGRTRAGARDTLPSLEPEELRATLS